jgi:mRNA deadenylase 3'-5' endonuclease subunit Ccr4
MGRQLKSKKTAKKKTPTSNNRDDNNSNSSKGQKAECSCWVDKVRLEPRDETDLKDANADTISIISWNVLAEAYCSRYSQVQLPVQYQKVVFSKTKRKESLLRTLQQLLCIHSEKDSPIDVICLQEVDLPEIGETLRAVGGYVGVETPRVIGGGAGGRTDACAVYVRENKGSATDTNDDHHDGTSACRWQLVDHDIVRLDDLATISSTTNEAIRHKISESPSPKVNTSSNVQGMQMSLLRRNMAVIVRLRHTISGKTIIIANAHLYWNPGFEYVKVGVVYVLVWLSAFTALTVTFSRANSKTHTHCFVRSCTRSTVVSSALYFTTCCCFSEV